MMAMAAAYMTGSVRPAAGRGGGKGHSGFCGGSRNRCWGRQQHACGPCRASQIPEERGKDGTFATKGTKPMLYLGNSSHTVTVGAPATSNKLWRPRGHAASHGDPAR